MQRSNRTTYIVLAVIVTAIAIGAIIIGSNPDLFGTAEVDPTQIAQPPPDSDGDGVLDDADACPQQGDAGFGLGGDGCPLPEPTPVPPTPVPDSDGDGVLDDADACPQQGDAGFGLGGDGCPLAEPTPVPPTAVPDSDGDGVLDDADACPQQGDVGFGLGGDGCPLAEPTPVLPTDVPPTEAQAAVIPPTQVPPTAVPPTDVPPTDVPPTQVPPTAVPPTDVPPTDVPPTDVPPTDASPTASIQDDAPEESELENVMLDATPTLRATSPARNDDIVQTCRIDARFVTPPDEVPVVVEWSVVDRQNVDSVEWTLTDGSTSSASTVQSTYDQPGTYGVTLRCSGPLGVLSVNGSVTIAVSSGGGVNIITVTPSPTLPPTNTPLPTATNTRRPTRTPRPSHTPTATNTDGPSPTPTATNTRRPTRTPRPSHTPTATLTPSVTATDGPSPTPTPSNTLRPTDTLTPTITLTPVPNCEISATQDPTDPGTYVFSLSNPVGIVNSSWTIDGSQIQGQSVSVSFSEVGIKRVELVCDTGSSSIIRTVFIQVDVVSSLAVDEAGILVVTDTATTVPATATPTLTNTPTPEPPTTTPTIEPTATHTATPEPPTNTPEPTATSTATPEPPTVTPTTDPTAIPVPPANTPTIEPSATNTNTVVPTTEPSVTHTATPVTPTATMTTEPSPPTTLTPVPPTATPEDVATSVSLPSSTPTQTGVPVTDQPDVSVCDFGCLDRVIFHTDRTDDWELFRLVEGDPEGGINLSNADEADDLAPSLSPDGAWIAFTSNRDGNWEIYIVPTSGNDSIARRVTFNTIAVDADPVWSVNNDLVFESSRNGTYDLYMIDLTTGEDRRLTDHPGNDLNAYWSPDGTRILFTSDRDGDWQIYELMLATGNVTRISDGLGVDLDPAYSPDGSHIVFRSYRDSDISTIYTVRRSGGEPVAISAENLYATNAVWSPDGRLIAYQGEVDGRLEIYVYEVATDMTRQLTDNAVLDYAPTWRCNPTELVWTSEINDDPELYQTNVLPISAPPIDIRTTAERLTDHPANDIYPEDRPNEENASREGYLPATEIGEVLSLGTQTDYLPLRAFTTPLDESLDQGQLWEEISLICPSG